MATCLYSVSSSSWNVSRNEVELKHCIWKRNWAPSGSPERAVILRPSSCRKEAVVLLSGPCDSTATGWNSSGRQFGVFWTFPVSSLFSDRASCMTCCSQVGSTCHGADCDIPCQTSSHTRFCDWCTVSACVISHVIGKEGCLSSSGRPTLQTCACAWNVTCRWLSPVCLTLT